MVSNAAVLILSLSTLLFSIASFQVKQIDGFESAVLTVIVSGLAWAAGAASAYFVSALREVSSSRSLKARTTTNVLFVVLMGIFPLMPSGLLGSVLIAGAMFCSGILIPSIISLQATNGEEMRDAFAKSLIGAALGAVLQAAFAGSAYGWSGPNVMCLIAAAFAVLSTTTEPRFILPSRS